MSKISDNSQVTWAGTAPAPPEQATAPERRSAQRFPFTAAAEVIDLQSKARVAGRTSDLGLGGCYIDTPAPLAVGARVQIRLEQGKREFEAAGAVTYALVSMGMGLAFTEIKPEFKAVLKGWIAELSGEKIIAIEEMPPAPKPAAQETVARGQVAAPEDVLAASPATNRLVLNELINLMVRKKVISEEEAAALLRQIYR